MLIEAIIIREKQSWKLYNAHFQELEQKSDWRDTSKSVFRGKIRGYVIDTLLDMDDYVEVDT